MKKRKHKFKKGLLTSSSKNKVQISLITKKQKAMYSTAQK